MRLALAALVFLGAATAWAQGSGGVAEAHALGFAVAFVAGSDVHWQDVNPTSRASSKWRPK